MEAEEGNAASRGCRSRFTIRFTLSIFARHRVSVKLTGLGAPGILLRVALGGSASALLDILGTSDLSRAGDATALGRGLAL